MKKYKLTIVPMDLMSGHKVLIEHEATPDLITTMRPLVANGLMVGRKIVMLRVLHTISDKELTFQLYSATNELLGTAFIQEVK